MTPVGFIKRFFRNGTGRKRPVSLAGGWDSAQTSHHNQNHWAQADHLSPNQAASPEVRRTLRSRCRYEVQNNPHVRGVVTSLADYIVGTGPRLQLAMEDSETAKKVERLFWEWAEEVDLAEKLRIMRMARSEDGEIFGAFISNQKLKSRVKLDLRLIPAAQVTSPFMDVLKTNTVDGIEYDTAGNPIKYTILKEHPGEATAQILFDVVKAELIVHYFNPERAGQKRGIPELTPALPTLSQLRRYILAVLSAAEISADFSAVIYTDAPASGDAEEFDAGEHIPAERGSMVTMPSGWKVNQLKAEHPIENFKEYVETMLVSAFRCCGVPRNIILGDSSGYNFASSKVDHQTFQKFINVNRKRMVHQVIDPIFHAWINEAVLIEGFLPESLRSTNPSFKHEWFWDGVLHIDPSKEANATKTKLESNTTTLKTEYAKDGKDWEVELRQRGEEKKLMDALGLKEEESAPQPEGAIDEK